MSENAWWLQKEWYVAQASVPFQLKNFQPDPAKERIPRYNEEGLYQSAYEGDNDE